ncbi:hypothetical protein B0A48_13095 [Cryoendolithus antarcticus]|uniref:FHA domain-containing protein n=1 Tax=Cryoendolithus antarcticus TaxID=1507870 RepID=A0A1V8SN66_9PEZI|nr:hypothetical protein B0A48_13095 [Cryoendolithus antarcticus]
MTAVAPPVNLQQNGKIGWSNGTNGNAYPAMTQDEVSKMMFAPGPRKTVARQNSASSLASTSSSTSTISASSSTGTNGTAGTAPTSVGSGEAGSWAVRKKPTRGLWPPGKAEPATGLSTARPQPVTSNSSGQIATTAISAIHAPMLPSQQMANGTSLQNGGAVRSQNANEPPAILHLLPINGTFERKTITVPYYPEVLRIGRQTNAKTIPTPLNGYFDSKVLSRQHAEVYADRNGRIFIKDVKSSNGTFVNGMRLSPENKESEPREVREQDVLELGIDIVSEDQKTVVHHKVAAKVEHAGVYQQGGDSMNFGDLDPSGGNGMLVGGQPMKRTGSQTSINGRGASNMPGQMALNGPLLGQPTNVRNWLNPITTEHIVKKLNTEMKLAIQQSQDLQRARQCIEAMLGSENKSPGKDSKPASEKSKPSPVKSLGDLKSHFSEPPAPPPQAPLPEKPDVIKALADPLIQPLLRRADTTRPVSNSSSPTRMDHSSDILRLCEALKLAKGELSSQAERMKGLETQLAEERTARETAEQRAQGSAPHSPTESSNEAKAKHDSPQSKYIFQDGSIVGTEGLQAQLERLQDRMDQMKTEMESYRQRAENAEIERDEATKTLAEMVEEKRRENAGAVGLNGSVSRNASRSRPNSSGSGKRALGHERPTANGHAILPAGSLSSGSATTFSLLEKAGLEDGGVITPAQAKILQDFLSHEVLGDADGGTGLSVATSANGQESALMYHGRPLTSAALVVLVGVCLMGWINNWKVAER